VAIDLRNRRRQEEETRSDITFRFYTGRLELNERGEKESVVLDAETKRGAAKCRPSLCVENQETMLLNYDRDLFCCTSVSVSRIQSVSGGCCRCNGDSAAADATEYVDEVVGVVCGAPGEYDGRTRGDR
jgi:hypothetical protein